MGLLVNAYFDDILPKHNKPISATELYVQKVPGMMGGNIIKNIVLALFVIFMALALFEGIRSKTNPLVQPEKQLRENLLKHIPLGTHMNDVIQIIKSRQDWVIKGINYEHGFIRYGSSEDEEIGKKSIRVSMGDYRIFSNYYFATNVTAFFGFNENDELIEIWVWKTTDGL